MVTLYHAMPELLRGLATTFVLSLVTLLFGTVLGFVFGILRALRVRVLGPAIGLLIHVVRGTPFLVQLYIVYFVLPDTGLRVFDFDAYTAAVLALSIYTSTYAAEITRGAMEAVPVGQTDAAKALGLSLPQRLLLVILPQARLLMIPPLGGLYVVIVKSTSIVSVVGIGELVRAGDSLALRAPQHLLVIYGAVALLYFAYCFPLLRLVRWLEQRSGRHLVRS
ncbi:amino acid ABC transporter permease [Sinorhizobium meliloti]|uniref:amino acid ABC transporter permease n=1 Tax=Rhizobium meliloti TaxID=382 RepID=UPI000FD866B2|nr:amino acid ABC transporter permease [Sinorhizobium meliloti]RVP19065.1 amino acid ABC transporter permease [Sinorhizobium meliloti]